MVLLTASDESTFYCSKFEQLILLPKPHFDPHLIINTPKNGGVVMEPGDQCLLVLLVSLPAGLFGRPLRHHPLHAWKMFEGIFVSGCRDIVIKQEGG